MSGGWSRFINVPKDERGFDDLESFWKVSDELNGGGALTTGPTSSDKEVQRYCEENGLRWLLTRTTEDSSLVDEELNFDYDTTSTITDADFVEEESWLESDEGGHNSQASVSGGSRSSALFSDVEKSGIASASGYLAGISSRSLLSITGLSDVVVEKLKQSRTDTSNASSNYTGRSSSTPGSSRRDATPSSTSRTNIASGAGKYSREVDSSHSSTVISSAKRSDAQQSSPSLINSASDSNANNRTEWSTVDDLDLSGDHTRSAVKTNGKDTSALSRSARRVSFGDNIELSPITAVSPAVRSSDGVMLNTTVSSEPPASSERKSRSSRSSASRVNYSDDNFNFPEADEADSRGINDMNASATPRSAMKKTPSMSTSQLSSQKKSARGSRTNGSESSSRRHSLGSLLATPGSNEFTRGVRVTDETFEEIATDVEEEEEEFSEIGGSHRKSVSTDVENAESSFVDNSFLFTIDSANPKYRKGKMEVKSAVLEKEKTKGKASSKISKKLYDSDEEEASPPASEDDPDDDDISGEGLRRSRRATKGKRFAYWKGERPIYEQGTMVGLLTADPTPLKPRKKLKTVQKRKRDHDDADHGNAAATTFDNAVEDILPAFKLPKGVSYVNIDEGYLAVWDDMAGSESEMKVVTTFDSLQPASALPKTARRPAGRDKVGYAAHCFNVPEVPGLISGWISGYVALPPEAIKDAEGVGKYSQVFFVSDCQDGALELGIAHPQLDVWEASTAQRMLLKKGDSFFIPPGNIYRLENHSKAKSCMLFWTIIKPIEEEDGASDMAVAISGASSSKTLGADSDNDLAHAAAVAAANAVANSGSAIKRNPKKKKQ